MASEESDTQHCTEYEVVRSNPPEDVSEQHVPHARIVQESNAANVDHHYLSDVLVVLNYVYFIFATIFGSLFTALKFLLHYLSQTPPQNVNERHEPDSRAPLIAVEKIVQLADGKLAKVLSIDFSPAQRHVHVVLELVTQVEDHYQQDDVGRQSGLPNPEIVKRDFPDSQLELDDLVEYQYHRNVPEIRHVPVSIDISPEEPSVNLLETEDLVEDHHQTALVETKSVPTLASPTVPQGKESDDQKQIEILVVCLFCNNPLLESNPHDEECHFLCPQCPRYLHLQFCACCGAPNSTHRVNSIQSRLSQVPDSQQRSNTSSLFSDYEHGDEEPASVLPISLNRKVISNSFPGDLDSVSLQSGAGGDGIRRRGSPQEQVHNGRVCEAPI